MQHRSATISEIQSEIEGALDCLRGLEQRSLLPRELLPLLRLAPPDGGSVHVSLRLRESGRPLRPADPARAWVPQSGGLWIVFEAPAELRASGPAAPPVAIEAALPDFVRALDHAEKDPQLQFVSLKWFRDTYLLKRGLAWASDMETSRRLVQVATESGMVTTDKVPNPRLPSFPVTSLRLNRAHPEVRRILESGDAG